MLHTLCIVIKKNIIAERALHDTHLKLHISFRNQTCQKHMKSYIAKRVNSILINLRYLRFKLLKYKENNKKICNTFDHNFKNIPLYIMRKVSLERYYFVLYDGALTLKMSKMALNSFCDKTLHYTARVSSWLERDIQITTNSEACLACI